MPRAPKNPFRRPRRFCTFGQGPFFYWAMFTRMAERSWPAVLSALAAQTAFTATGVVLPMLLGKEPYGDYQTILSLIKWPQILALFPVGAVLPRYLAHHHDDPEKRRIFYGAAFLIVLVAVGLSLAILGSLGFALMRTYRVSNYPGSTFGLGVGIVLLNALAMFFMSVLQGYGRTRWWSVINIVGVLLVCAIMIAGAWGYSRWGMGAVGLAGLAAWGPYLAMSSRAALKTQGYLLTLRAAWAAVWELVKASTPMLISTAAVFASHAWIGWLLVDRLPDGKVQVGYFFLTFGSFFMVVPVAFGGLSIPLLPEWARMFRNRRYRALVRAFDGAIVLTTIAGAVFGLALYTQARPLVMALYGPEYAPLIASLKVAAWWCPIFMTGASFFLLGMAMGRTGKVMWANLALSAIVSAAGWWLAEDGSRGVCVAMLAGYVVWAVVYAALGVADIRVLLRGGD